MRAKLYRVDGSYYNAQVPDTLPPTWRMPMPTPVPMMGAAEPPKMAKVEFIEFQYCIMAEDVLGEYAMYEEILR